MIDEKWGDLRARRNNVRHYRRLFQTELTDLERRFVERRLNEENLAMESLTSSPQKFLFTPFARQCKSLRPWRPPDIAPAALFNSSRQPAGDSVFTTPGSPLVSPGVAGCHVPADRRR